MEFNEKRAKEAAIDTGAAAGGAIIGAALLAKAGELATSKVPSIAVHVPAIALAAALALQAFEVLPDNNLVDSAMQGFGVVATMQTVRQYGGANTPAAAAGGNSMAALIAKYVPNTSGDTTVALPAPTTTPTTTTTGVQGIGSLMPYRDPAQAALLAGNYQRQLAASGGSLQNLGSAPSGRTSILQNLG